MSFLDKTGLARLWVNTVALADTKVPTSRKINGKELTGDITLLPSDIGAAESSHNHDSRYYTESEVDTKLGNKSDKTHNHDSAYDAKGAANTALNTAKAYTDTIKNDLLNGAGAAYDTLKELGDLIDDNQDAIEALETVASSKANASDLTAHTTDTGIHIKQGTGEYAEVFNDRADNVASGKYSHAEGGGTKALGPYTHAEGLKTKATGNGSHAEGSNLNSSGSALSDYKISLPNGSSVTISGSIAAGISSHAEGVQTYAGGYASHAEGRTAKAFGSYSHAEGYWTTASGEDSHAEGEASSALGLASHAEGSSWAYGDYSHAEGTETTASGNASHAEGSNTVASGEFQHVQGKYNIIDEENEFTHIIGNGSADNSRSNAHTVDWSGNAWYAGDIYVGSTSGTNKDAGSKKVATVEEISSTVNEILYAPATESVFKDWNGEDIGIYHYSSTGDADPFVKYQNNGYETDIRAGAIKIAEDQYSDKQYVSIGINGIEISEIKNPQNGVTASSTIKGDRFSGIAASANKINTDAGNTNTPVYFANGIPVACDNVYSKAQTDAAIQAAIGDVQTVIDNINALVGE